MRAVRSKVLDVCVVFLAGGVFFIRRVRLSFPIGRWVVFWNQLSFFAHREISEIFTAQQILNEKSNEQPNFLHANYTRTLSNLQTRCFQAGQPVDLVFPFLLWLLISTRVPPIRVGMFASFPSLPQLRRPYSMPFFDERNAIHSGKNGQS